MILVVYSTLAKAWENVDVAGLDFTHGVVVSRGRGNVGYKILSLACAKGVIALEIGRAHV